MKLQKTKERLQAVEDRKYFSATEMVDSYISGKIVLLKEQIAILEKREERYKAVFADRISVFRRACCELFGYKANKYTQQRDISQQVEIFIQKLNSRFYCQFDIIMKHNNFVLLHQ